MKLWVRVLDARHLRARDLNGLSDPYVRLQLAEKKFKTKVVKKNLNPTWKEAFCFEIDELDEELLISVMDEDRYFKHDLIGQLNLHVEMIYDAPNKSLGTMWYNLLPKKSKNKDCGQILLSILFSEWDPFSEGTLSNKGDPTTPYMDRFEDLDREPSSVPLNDSLGLSLSSPSQSPSSRSSSFTEEELYAHGVMALPNQSPQMNGKATSSRSTGPVVMGSPETPKFQIHGHNVYESKIWKQYSDSEFDEAIRIMASNDRGIEVPSNLPGGVLVDQSYVVAPSDLNILLFSPKSNFTSSLADVKGNKRLEQEPWKFGSDGESLKRGVTYIKAATKMMKATNAFEEQKYLKANGDVFSVLVGVSTPDAMYGNAFLAETLYCITPGPELQSGEKSSRLVISWHINFLRSTMMKGMIEGGARKAFKESFEHFAILLAQNVKPVVEEDLQSKPGMNHQKGYESQIKLDFDEAMRIMESNDEEVEDPGNLPGGVLVDQLYMIAPADLNILLFSSESKFPSSLAVMKGNTELQQEQWGFSNDRKRLKRTITYIKAANRMMKAMKTIEEQTYLNANGSVFAVLVSVNTPDALYGSTFRVETLYCITAAPELLSGENSSRLVISWRINFLQTTMMRGMIEDGAQKGLKESFKYFTSLLSQKVEPIDFKDTAPEPEIYDNHVAESETERQSPDGQFNEAMRSLELKDSGEMPSTLPGGVLVDQAYVVEPSDLNILLFSSESDFVKSLADIRGNKELQLEPWKFGSDGRGLKRTVTYIKVATKMAKAMKAIEEQTYLKANGKIFAVLVSTSAPDAMYGKTFRVETLYCITPGSDLPSGEKTSKLMISWRMNFLQSTMMRGMIEGGARKGLKDSFEQFTSMLNQSVMPVNLQDYGSDREQVLSSLHIEEQTDLTLATQYLLNSTVVSAAIFGFYVFLHILLATAFKFHRLQFSGLDLPDSFTEIIISTILVIQAQRALPMILRFLQARVQKGSDHGVKAQGDGWVLTIALIEGSSLASIDSTGFSDPFVVFTCNGKTKTSSIKFEKLDPQWNEVFEFDAMDEPPSLLDVEVYAFDGPFDKATSLGHAEINFVKDRISELADIWIPLQGNLAVECKSKLRLKIFLDNTKGNGTIKEYLAKMEKEVGKKINVPSPETNAAFQKVFGLPSEEFLINDFTCRLKRKMLLQGRIFLSARIIGFHANLFGNRTTFFFLWEDIEDIQILSPTLTSMGSPSLILILWKGRGLDARHGAKKEDEEGRLKFHFHSFGSFDVAHSIIMALWKAKSMSPEQKLEIVEKETEGKYSETEESASLLDLEDASLSEVYSSVVSVPTKFFMELFGGGYLDSKVMEKVGCLDYSHTSWELLKTDVYQRQISYRFDKHISHYEGEATATQQLSSSSEGWIIEEVMNLHRIPLGDHFTVHTRYQVGDLPLSEVCNVQMFFGIAWLKSAKHQKRLTQNIGSNVVDRMKMMFSLMEREYIQQL